MSVDMPARDDCRSCRRYSLVAASAKSSTAMNNRSARTSVASQVLTTGKAVLAHGKTILDDLMNKNLFALKMIWFLEMAGVVAIWPYNSLHMQQLGLDINDISVVQSTSRMVGAVTPLVTGVIADQIGDFKIYLAFVLLVEGLAGASVLLIPSANTPHKPPESPSTCYQQTVNHSYMHSINCTSYSQRKHDTSHDSTCRDVCTTANLLSQYICEPIKCQYLANDLDHLSKWPFASGNTTINCSGDNNTTCVLSCFSNSHHNATCTSRPIFKNKNKANETGGSSLPGTNDSDAIVDKGTVLGWYIALRMLYSYGLASTYTLVDATTLSYCSQLGANYALQRVWGSLAAIITAPLFGYLIKIYSGGSQYNYSVAFLALLIIRILGIPLLGPLTLKYREKQSCTWWRKAGGLFTNPDFLILLPIPIVLGMCTGHLEAHVYIFLDKLGFSVTLIAGTISIGNATEILLLLLGAGAVLRFKRGRFLMLLIGTIVAGFRFIGYQFLQQSWALLLLETLDGVTGGILAPALMTSAVHLVPANMIATMRGLLGTILYGLAPVLGTILSGQMITSFGYRWSFGLMGYMLLVTAILFGVSWLLRQWHVRAKQKRSAPNITRATNEPVLNKVCHGSTSLDSVAATDNESLTNIDRGIRE